MGAALSFLIAKLQNPLIHLPLMGPRRPINGKNRPINGKNSSPSSPPLTLPSAPPVPTTAPAPPAPWGPPGHWPAFGFGSTFGWHCQLQSPSGILVGQQPSSSPHSDSHRGWEEVELRQVLRKAFGSLSAATIGHVAKRR